MLDALLDLFDRDRRRSRGLLARFGDHDHDHDRDERPVSRRSGSPHDRHDDERWDDDGEADPPRHRRPQREAFDLDD